MEVLKNIEEEINKTQVIILAGGRAKRMGKIDKPKALLELNGKTLLDYCIEFLVTNGFKNFVFLLGYKHEEIEKYIGDGSKYGVRVKYSIDPENIKGRAKALKHALINNEIDKTKRALIFYPDDLYLDKKLPIKFLLHHLYGVENKKILVTSLFVSGTAYPYGVAEIDSEQFVKKFIEKPFIYRYTNTAFYIIEPEVYKEIEEKIDLNSKENPEFEHTILPDLASRNKVFSMVQPSSLWLPINTFKEQERAGRILKNNNL